MIKELKHTQQFVYRNVNKNSFYMIELRMNSKDVITKITEKESKNLKDWKIINNPYTYITVKGVTLEKVFDVMKKDLKNIYDIRDEKNGDKLY